MHKNTINIPVLAMSLSLISFMAHAQNVTEPQNIPAEWSSPYQPFQIAGNLYYVGTYDLACYLIVTTQGNILINTGLASSVSSIRDNIEALGFKFTDTKILLTTQAHYDHMGAMAAIQKLTGARMMADFRDSAVVADGGSSDYALGGNGSTYEPVKIDRLLHNGDTIQLGNTQLVLLHHPGHTEGSCSYLFKVKDDKRTYKVLIANMPTIVTDKKFSELPAYPDIAKDYAYTIDNLKKLSFDIWLSSHASQFGLHTKHRPGDSYNPSAFMDRKGYDKAISDLQVQFEKKMEEK